jgi:hypothetical protein
LEEARSVRAKKRLHEGYKEASTAKEKRKKITELRYGYLRAPSGHICGRKDDSS